MQLKLALSVSGETAFLFTSVRTQARKYMLLTYSFFLPVYIPLLVPLFVDSSTLTYRIVTLLRSLIAFLSSSKQIMFNSLHQTTTASAAMLFIWSFMICPWKLQRKLQPETTPLNKLTAAIAPIHSFIPNMYIFPVQNQCVYILAKVSTAQRFRK